MDRVELVDIIHAHVSYPGGYIASLLSREFGIPYVLTEHMSPFPFPGLMRNGSPRNEISEAFDNASATIAVSKSLAERIASFGYQTPKVIPNVIDERRFQIGDPSRKKFVFFTLGGLSSQKGIDVLLQSIAKWNPPPDQFEFRIGGDGPQRSEYKKLADKLRVSDRVRWLGPVSRDDAPRLFQECHAFVMPSRHETFGVVFAEAIASGKPIIATKCGGPESIANDSNGILVEIGDVQGLVTAMKDVAKDIESYSPDAIRLDFMNRFSRQAVVPQLLSVYEDSIKRHFS
jgi:glycosyltransferase involved in cell wall biosynthesis